MFSLAAAVCARAPLPVEAQPASQSALTDEQKALHVLNRLGFGPRPGDIDRVLEMGLEAYVEQQLHPNDLESPRLKEKLEVFDLRPRGWDELKAMDRPAVARAEHLRMSVSERAARREAASPKGAPRRSERLREHVRNGDLAPDVTAVDRRYEDFVYVASLMWRATYTEAQLEEILVDFWFNHFNITAGDPYIHADYGENVIRRHALGRFEDLLVATAQHPGMLVYLDNWLSSAPREVVEERLAAWQPDDGEPKALWLRRNQAFLDRVSGLNENYARELMELHTLGVDGGYTQADVEEVARAFTGWTLEGWQEGGRFEFSPLLHEGGDKTVLGRVIPSAGMDEGMQILHMLAHHPSTARFVSTKLARRFVADDPPETIVAAASERFLETDGDIREVLRAIFFHPDFFSPESYQAKVKKPFEAVVSALRAVDAEIDNSFLGPNFGQISAQMGERLRVHETPDGYPDVATAWVSTNSLFKRLVFAMDVAAESLPGLEVDLDGARSLFQRMGFPEPTPEMIADARELFTAMKNEGDGGGAGMAGDMQSEPMRPGPPGDDQEEERPDVDYESLEAKVVAVALVLGSPDFQKR